MHLLPPRSSAERLKWAQAHPWLAGSYFGLFMFAFAAFLLPVFMKPRVTVGVELLIGASASLLGGLLFAIGTKRRWGLRPDAESQPLTYRRLEQDVGSLAVVLLVGVARSRDRLSGSIRRRTVQVERGPYCHPERAPRSDRMDRTTTEEDASLGVGSLLQA